MKKAEKPKFAKESAGAGDKLDQDKKHANKGKEDDPKKQTDAKRKDADSEAGKLLKELKAQREEQKELLSQQRAIIEELQRHKDEAHAEIKVTFGHLRTHKDVVKCRINLVIRTSYRPTRPKIQMWD